MDQPNRRASQPAPEKVNRLSKNDRNLRDRSKRPMQSIQELEEGSDKVFRGSQSIQEDDDFNASEYKLEQRPVKRNFSKALSEMEVASQPVSKIKQKNKKKQNEGNIFLEETRIKKMFKELCDPNGNITIDSLGHTMQKYHIQFQLRDVADMLGLLWMLKDEEIPQGQELRVAEDQKGQFDISGSLKSNQFQQLFRLVRRKR